MVEEGAGRFGGGCGAEDVAAMEELVVVPGERGGVLAAVEAVKAVVEMMATMKEVLVVVEDMLTR